MDSHASAVVPAVILSFIIIVVTITLLLPVVPVGLILDGHIGCIGWTRGGLGEGGERDASEFGFRNTMMKLYAVL